MEIITFASNWGYTLIIALVLIALIIWKGGNFKIPRPDKNDVKGILQWMSEKFGRDM